jgi:hypothetical protein
MKGEIGTVAMPKEFAKTFGYAGKTIALQEGVHRVKM